MYAFLTIMPRYIGWDDWINRDAPRWVSPSYGRGLGMADASVGKRRDAALDDAPGREHFIYSISFDLGRKCYIGQSVNPQRRWWTHKSALMTNKHWCAELQKDWNENGKAAFAFIILQGGLFSNETADAAERDHIINRDCYNYLVVRDVATGRLSPTDLSRKKQSDSLKKAWNNPDSDLRNPTRKRFDDPRQRTIQSQSQKNRYLNPEERQKTAETTKAAQTPKVRLAKSIAAKASWSNPNSKQHSVIRTLSPEGKKSKSEKMKAFWNSPEGIEKKLIKAKKLKAYWNDPTSKLRNRKSKPS